MDLKPLKQFLALTETLHFSRASEICHVSPSTLTRTIKQLEAELGVTLFERDNREVRITPEGRRFQQYARDTLMQWDLLRNAMQAQQGELQGEISLYCSVTASYSFLYAILSEFRRRHPRIEIKLHTGDPELAIARILAGHEDIAIAARPDSLASGLAFKPMADSPLVFIAPAQEASIDSSLEQSLGGGHWGDVPMILSEGGLARRRINAWFKDKGLKPTIYAQVAGNEAIVSMVSLGFGVGVVPKIVLDNSPLVERVRILPVTPQLAGYQVGLFTLEKKLNNPLIHAFWSLLNPPH